jgi:hypothetical protein
MGIDATALISGALGGAALQSVLEPLLGQRHLRRDLRANVLKAVTRVEYARWAPRSRDDFRQSVADLRAQVLVAGLPRRPAEVYIEAVAAARTLSDRDWDESGGGDSEVPGGLIPTEMGDYVAACATNLVATAWHPHRTKFSVWLRLRKLGRHKEELTEELADEPRSTIDWGSVWIPR